MIDYQKKIENAKNKLKQHPDILDINKEYIIDFLSQLSAEDLSIGRQLKYLYTLKPIAMGLKKDFSLFNKKDVITLLNELNNSNYKDNTKRDFKIVIKRFFRWLREQEGKSYEEGGGNI
jgi:hypothetical protein